MLTIPRYNRSILDTLDDQFFHPMEHYLPRPIRRSFRVNDNEIAIPTVKDDKFNLNLDFGQFDPADITVKVENDTLLVKGKKEKKSEGIYECREFVQKFNVPKNVIADRMTCNLDRSGYLRIEAPVKVDVTEEKNGRVIPVKIVHKTSFEH